MTDNQSGLTTAINNAQNDTDTINQFAVSQIPFHTHNGLDASNVSFQNLTNRNEYLNIIIPGTSAQTATNFGVFFTAPYKCQFKSATEVHGVAGTSTPTLQIEKLIGTTATGSGTSLLQTAFNLAGTANTVQNAVLANLTNASFSLNIGDRLGLLVSGTLTTLSHVVVIVQLMY
jgi:hypothetical protein